MGLLDSLAQVRGKYFCNLTLYTCSPRQPGHTPLFVLRFTFVLLIHFFFRHTLLSVNSLACHVNTLIHSLFSILFPAAPHGAPGASFQTKFFILAKVFLQDDLRQRTNDYGVTQQTWNATGEALPS